jgi:hypothetical protein
MSFKNQKTEIQKIPDQLRPPALLLPEKAPPTSAFVVFQTGGGGGGGGGNNNDRDCNHEDKGYLMKSVSFSGDSYDSSSSSSSNDGTAAGSRSGIVYALASMNLPNAYVIPESRIKTPRAAKTPSSVRNRDRRVTLSPTDELMNPKESPTKLLAHHYKAVTPRLSSNFRL